MHSFETTQRSRLDEVRMTCFGSQTKQLKNKGKVMLLGFCWRTKNSAPFRVLRVWKCLEELFSHLLKDLQALLLSAAHFRSPHSRSCTSPCSYHRLLSHHPLHFSCMNFVQYIHSSPMSKPRQPCLSSKPFNFNYPSLILFLIILVFDRGKN